MTKLLAGAAEADMTPPVGTAMAGGWRPKPAESIETPLMAHALVLSDGETRIAVVGLDLIAILAKDAGEAKRRIQARTGIPPENVLIACSHTHEAPYPAPLLGDDTNPDPAFMAKVIDATADAVIRAAESLAPAEVGFGAAHAPGVCANRRIFKTPGDVVNAWMLSREERQRFDSFPAAGPVDDEVLVLGVRRASGELLALLWNFTLHAHAFWKQSICADYPYFTAQKLAGTLGPGPVFVFTAGACGDINKRDDVPGAAIVDALSRAILQALDGMKFTPRAQLATTLAPAEYPLRDFSVFQEEEIRRKLPSALEVARGEWEILRAMKDRTVRTVVQAVRIGDFALAAVPGEYFCALGLDVKRRSPFARTALVELANDYIGYVPTSAAFDQGGYELFNLRSSKVARGAGEQIADEVVGLLQELHSARPNLKSQI